MFIIERIYDHPRVPGEYRILVDRLWPRGVSREKASLDEWIRDIAPGDDLRKWFGHDAGKWDKFRQKYTDELKMKNELISKLRRLEQENTRVTLLFAAKDEIHNNARVLLEFLNSNIEKE
jgi:uncharacterized protein YeaO (DUF488 family)